MEIAYQFVNIWRIKGEFGNLVYEKISMLDLQSFNAHLQFKTKAIL